MNQHKFKASIESVDELDKLLTTPNDGLITDLAELDGDIMIIGASGKMGPTLAVLAKRALKATGDARNVIAVSRFSDASQRKKLESVGISTIVADLFDPSQISALPQAENVIYMLATKFGTSGAEYKTWATNAFVAGKVAERFQSSRCTVFSTGNVYPLQRVSHGGSIESEAASPMGEYAQSCLARERIFEYVSRRSGMPVAIIRLNYAIDLRYGVLHDVAMQVRRGATVDLSMGNVNVIWQGDVCSIALRALKLADSPPAVYNLTGPETISIRWLAHEFAKRFGVKAKTINDESETALLNNAANCFGLFGYPSVPLIKMIDWVSDWIERDMPVLNKPTHFQERDGNF